MKSLKFVFLLLLALCCGWVAVYGAIACIVYIGAYIGDWFTAIMCTIGCIGAGFLALDQIMVDRSKANNKGKD